MSYIVCTSLRHNELHELLLDYSAAMCSHYCDFNSSSCCVMLFHPLSIVAEYVKTNNFQKKNPSFIVDKRAKTQAIIGLCMKYSWGFQTAPESPASLGPLLLAEIQTHQTPSSPRKQAAFSYQHTCNHAHERP